MSNNHRPTSDATQPARDAKRRSSGSGIPGRGFSRTDRARRRVDHTRSYGLAQRVADNFHGLVDAQGPERPLSELPWVRRLQHTYAENGARVFAGTRDMLAEPITGRRAAQARSSRLSTQIDALLGQAVAIRDRATETVPAAAPHYGEQHLGAVAAAVRRERDADTRRARLVAEADAAQTQIFALQSEQADADEDARRSEATVEEEFEVAATVVLRMRDYYMRRLATYSRRLSRRGKLSGTYDVAVPRWAEEPCPWLSPDRA